MCCNRRATTVACRGRCRGDMAGTLYVVATPLGNLDDLSPRAAATLRQGAPRAAGGTPPPKPPPPPPRPAPRLVGFPAPPPPAALPAHLPPPSTPPPRPPP